MDDTAVMLSSLQHWPHLQHALDRYCAATTAQFNTAKTEILPFFHTAADIPAGLPSEPIGPDAPVRYLGVRIGHKLSIETRKALRETLLAETISAAKRSVLTHTTLEGRAYALRTFIYPRLIFAFTFEEFSMEQIHRTQAVLKRVFWGRIHGFLSDNLARHRLADGGYSLPTLP
ncbi:hypothetical protein LPJ77_007157, partial [Coemansia sp. RSA 2523]